MSWAQAALLVLGSAAVAAVAAHLAYEEPSPGALATAHASLPGLPRLPACAQCHADGGLDAGCLSCHLEIRAQLDARSGYHAQLVGDGPPDCARCHPDHHGETFDVREAVAWPGGRGSFSHEHVAFDLHGAHDALACDACHTQRSFLGLSQECSGCHEEIHGAPRFAACETCHAQDTFLDPPGFSHPTPLSGGHRGVACTDCHGAAPVFSDVAPRACDACHESPHRKELGRCEACHTEDAPPWTEAPIPAEVHAQAGFPLVAPHADVACASCHAPALAYDARHPSRTQDDCASCHEDPHAGQFQGTCLSCHERQGFERPRVDHSGFPLRGAHVSVACTSCHVEDAALGARRFVATPADCASCHADPHGGRLGTDCASCHGEDRFLPARYDLARHDAFPITGAHRAVSCRSCHVEENGVRRFAGTPSDCASCHANPHGRQFAPEMRDGGCVACHAADASTFSIAPFDHARWPLRDAHADASCAQCHLEREGVRAYRGTPSDCASCHEDAHRRQFRGSSCDRCHEPAASWAAPRFDHAKTDFPLDARHRPVACSSCHPAVPQPDGRAVVQYRPLGKQCGDCHATR